MLIQLIHDQFINSTGPGFISIFSRLFFRNARKLILFFYDPLVETDVAGAMLAIPLSHALPENLKVFPYYASNLGRLTALVRGKYPKLTIIDIGANIGDSIAVIKRGADVPVLCVEGNPVFFKTLVLNAARFQRVQTTAAYVGETNTSLFAEDKMLRGTSHISAGGGREIRIQSLSGILADYPDFISAKLIKIDTDGFDCKIIRGAEDFLSAARPAIFFEYDPLLLSRQGDDGFSVFDALRGLGYDSAVVYDNLGHYLLSMQLSDSKLLKELHVHFLSYQGARFGDFCVFHSEDRDLYETAVQREVEYFKKTSEQREGAIK